MTDVVLKKGRAKPLWFGHPWLFSEAIGRVEGSLEPGDEVRVLDDAGRFIGKGFANPRSQLRVRMATRLDEPLDNAWVSRRLADAKALRQALGLPSDETSAYRLVNSEGDGLPGLTVDVFGDAVCIQYGAYAMKRREGAIMDALAQLLEPRTMYEVTPGAFADIEGVPNGPRVARGVSRSTVPYRERGFNLEVEPLSGQKTGAFLDQRENRAIAERLAHGRRVLDLYCYGGGFGLAAARGGARSVTAVDSSSKAVTRARAHFAANGLGAEVVEADVFRFLEQAPAGAWDLIVCDPPKFASSRKDLESALRGYRRLNALCLQALAPGGVVLTCSCSGLVDAIEFERMLAGAAENAHRRLQVLEVRGAGPDHVVPVAFAEGRYLKVIVARAP